MRVIESLKTCFERHPGRYLLAVSGGRDSVVLLEGARQLGEAFGVAHFDHRLRAQSTEDARFVQVLSQKNPFFLGHYRGKQSDEAALREARYQFLHQTARDHGYDYVVTAHHALDQAETLLMRLIRGCGLEGLSAMEECQSERLRPLLRVSPEELATYAASRKLRWVEDSTNNSPRYLRNRLRQQVWPELVKLAEPYGRESDLLRRLGCLTREAGQWREQLRGQVEVWIDGNVCQTSQWARMDRSAFLQTGPFLRKSVLERLGHTLSGRPMELSREAYTRFERAVESEQRELSFGQGLQMVLSCGKLYLVSQSASFAPTLRATSDGRWNCDFLGIELELAEHCRHEIECRFFQPGDRFRSKKLKHVFYEMGVPRPERSLIPVAYSPRQREVVWFYPLASEDIQVRRLDFPLTVRP